jgi:hypothetical protein
MALILSQTCDAGSRVVTIIAQAQGAATETKLAGRLLSLDPVHVEAFAHLVRQAETFPGPLVYFDGQDLQALPARPTGAHTWSWDALAWTATAGAVSSFMAQSVAQALLDIDTEAGKARLRYITSVPGQEAVYLLKEHQARTWQAAGFAGEAPSFIAAESNALGVSAVSVAEGIIATANQWVEVKGPQIEAVRRKWKVTITDGPLTELAITAAREAALAELSAL